MVTNLKTIALLLLLPFVSMAQWSMDFDEEFSFAISSIDTHIVAWYKFDGNTIDSSIKKTDSTWTGTSAYTNGNDGTLSAKFNGSNGVRIQKSPYYNYGLTQATFSLWVYINNVVLSGQTVAIFDDTNTLSLNNGLICYYDESLKTIYFDNNAFGGFFALSGINTSGWYFLTFTYNATATSAFLNGVRKKITSTAGKAIAINNIMKIGTSSDDALPFIGAIDDFRVYDRSLSTNDVMRIYQGLKPLHD